MKSVISFVSLIVIVSSIADTNAELHCNAKPADIPRDWLDMVNPCVQAMRSQIQEELNASLQYLAMGAHFSRDVINRPGFAKTFFEAASEEREHASKLISYLLMRGELVSSVSNLIRTGFQVPIQSWENGVAALKDALKLEAHVTKKIRHVIATCENPAPEDFNDYHLVDYLTGEFLEEQHKGQRELAGRISQLEKLMDKHGKLGEFLFDKKLL